MSGETVTSLLYFHQPGANVWTRLCRSSRHVIKFSPTKSVINTRPYISVSWKDRFKHVVITTCSSLSIPAAWSFSLLFSLLVSSGTLYNHIPVPTHTHISHTRPARSGIPRLPLLPAAGLPPWRSHPPPCQLWHRQFPPSDQWWGRSGHWL